MSMIETTTLERRIAERVDPRVTDSLAVSDGGARFATMTEVMEAAKLMAISSLAVPKHLRGNVGACMAVVMQAIEWRLSPFAVANKSYSVNDRLAYESQLIQAVILQRAPIKGRFKVEYTGQGEQRVCRVSATLSDTGETVDYTSPAFSRITPKNSPLWKSDPDQQQFYYSGRALCRRHFPDVLLGIFDREEIAPDPDEARDITPAAPRTLTSRLDALAAKPDAEEVSAEAFDVETGEITLANEPAQADAPPTVDRPALSALALLLREQGGFKQLREQFAAWVKERPAFAEGTHDRGLAERIMALHRRRIEGVNTADDIDARVEALIEAGE